MSSNMYITIDGIEGETGVKDFPKAIEVLNYSYSCFQPVAEARSGTIHTSGRANHGTFNFSKLCDLATGKLCEHVWNGKTIPKAVFVATTNNGDQILKYLTITLENVVIANYSLHGSGNAISGEEVSLSFAKIKVEYNKHDETGAAKGKSAAGWDLSTETKQG